MDPGFPLSGCLTLVPFVTSVTFFWSQHAMLRSLCWFDNSERKDGKDENAAGKRLMETERSAVPGE